MNKFTESTVEEAALSWFESLGYAVLNGPEISPGGDTLPPTLSQRGRESYSDVVLVRRLRTALGRINPNIPEDALEDTVRKVLRSEHPSLIENNRLFHRYITDGVPVEYASAPSPRPSPTGRGGSEAEGEGLRRWGTVRR
jgi:type I restriction enzyme R subunit